MVTFHAKFNEITYIFSHNLFKILILQQLVNFLLAMKLSSDYLTSFKYLQIMSKIILKFVGLSNALARLGIILPIIREITCIKKGLKT
jgi:hypothetical protein